jgi:hypothetical protein
MMLDQAGNIDVILKHEDGLAQVEGFLSRVDQRGWRVPPSA